MHLAPQGWRLLSSLWAFIAASPATDFAVTVSSSSMDRQ